MPIYEYGCEKCGVVEVTQRISDPPLQKCPTCRRKVQRLISATSFQLKGSGWYVTDYGRGGKGKDGGAKDGEAKDGGAKSGEAKGGEAKSESTSPSESKPASSDAKPSSSTPGTSQSTSS